MKHEFRISSVAVRQMRHSIWITPLLVLGICAITVWKGSADTPAQLVITLSAVALAVGFAWSGYRKFARRAANHVLTVSEDALHFRDGSTDLRIPFSAVTSLAIKRRQSQVHGLVLTYESEKKLLHGYEDLQTLAQLLTARISPDRVKEFAWFHV